MSKFLKEWGVKRHGLWHSHASNMLASNVHPKIVQERLGHSSIAVTMDIYSHLMPNMQGEAASAVDGALRAAISKRADEVRSQSGSRRVPESGFVPFCALKRPKLSAR